MMLLDCCQNDHILNMHFVKFENDVWRFRYGSDM